MLITDEQMRQFQGGNYYDVYDYLYDKYEDDADQVIDQRHYQ